MRTCEFGLGLYTNGVWIHCDKTPVVGRVKFVYQSGFDLDACQEHWDSSQEAAKVLDGSLAHLEFTPL